MIHHLVSTFFFLRFYVLFVCVLCAFVRVFFVCAFFVFSYICVLCLPFLCFMCFGVVFFGVVCNLCCASLLFHLWYRLRFFFWAGSVGTSLASHKFPPAHRLLLLLAGPFQLFFAFYFFCNFVLSFFVFIPSFFVVPSLFIRKANRQQQLIRIFSKCGWHSALWRAAVQTIPFLVWISVWLTWPKTTVSLLLLQPHVPRFYNN